MASLPLVNRAVSKSGVPPMSASVGITVPGLPVSHSAAATPSRGVERRLAVGVEELAAGLTERLVELVEADRLVVAVHTGVGVGEGLGGGLLVLPRPVGRGVVEAGGVEQRLVVDQHDVGERRR